MDAASSKPLLESLSLKDIITNMKIEKLASSEKKKNVKIITSPPPNNTDISKSNTNISITTASQKLNSGILIQSSTTSSNSSSGATVSTSGTTTSSASRISHLSYTVEETEIDSLSLIGNSNSSFSHLDDLNWMLLWSAIFAVSPNCRPLNIAKKSRPANVKQHFSTVNFKNRLNHFQIPKQHPATTSSTTWVKFLENYCKNPTLDSSVFQVITHATDNPQTIKVSVRTFMMSSDMKLYFSWV